MKPQTVVIAVIAVAVIAVLAYGALDSENGDGSSDGPITNENGGTISVGPFVSNIDMGALIPVTESYVTRIATTRRFSTMREPVRLRFYGICPSSDPRGSPSEPNLRD